MDIELPARERRTGRAHRRSCCVAVLALAFVVVVPGTRSSNAMDAQVTAAPSIPAATEPSTAPTTAASTQPTTAPGTQPTTAPGTQPATAPSTPPAATQPAKTPAGIVYDTTLPRPVPPRDFLERWAQNRGWDLRLVDALMDPRTPVPPLERQPPASQPADARIAANLPVLDDQDPFPVLPPLASKEVTVRVGIARSTYRARTRAEVLSSAQPFVDLVQREVDVRGAAVLHESTGEIYYDLLEGDVQMEISHVFDYLLIQSWLAHVPDNGAVPLCWAAPANPRTTELDRGRPGVPGTSVELVVARDSPYETFADLKGARLALTASIVPAPGAFLTGLLQEIGQPPEQPYFGGVTLRLYPKDTVIDVCKGVADVACVDQGTLGALNRFYGLDRRLRTLVVSPRYHIDVLYTSVNNLETHRTQIELTQRMLVTLGKDAEGQEILVLFDEEGWYNYRTGDIDPAREHFDDFIAFLQNTPADLKPLLDPRAPVDRRTYGRYGDE